MNGAQSFYSPTNTPIVRKLAQVKPQRLVFIEEYDYRPEVGPGNLGSFLTFKKQTPAIWGDVPAFFHVKGSNMTFVDGHAEFHLWNDKRTFTAKAAPDPNSVQPGNNDLSELKYIVYGP